MKNPCGSPAPWGHRSQDYVMYPRKNTSTTSLWHPTPFQVLPDSTPCHFRPCPGGKTFFPLDTGYVADCTVMQSCRMPEWQQNLLAGKVRSDAHARQSLSYLRKPLRSFWIRNFCKKISLDVWLTLVEFCQS